MHPTPWIVRAAQAALSSALIVMAFASIPLSAKETPKTDPANDGTAIPGGNILSAAVSSVTPLSGSGGGAAAASYAATGRAAPITCPIKEDGTFEFKGLKPGKYELRISFPNGPRQTTDTSGSRQTQGKTFGEKVANGTSTADSKKTSHETAKNSIGNIRAREQGQSGGVSVAAGDVNGDGKSDTAKAIDPNSMPNRISMNVTIAKRKMAIEADGDPVIVEVGPDGVLKGRAMMNNAHSNPL